MQKFYKINCPTTDTEVTLFVDYHSSTSSEDLCPQYIKGRMTCSNSTLCEYVSSCETYKRFPNTISG